MRLVLTLLALAPLAFSQPDVDLLMRRAVEASARNDFRIRQYTWRTERVFFRVDKNGTRDKYTTLVWDATRIGDRTENKLISRNGVALTNPKPKDANLDAGLSLSLTVNTAIIARLFDLTYLREETFRGRKCWVVLATPKPDAIPKDDNDREVLNLRITLWWEQEGMQSPRGILEVANDKSQMDRGSTIEWIAEPNDEGVWLVREQHLLYTTKRLPKGTRGEWHELFTNYRKFDVKSRITADPE